MNISGKPQIVIAAFRKIHTYENTAAVRHSSFLCPGR